MPLYKSHPNSEHSDPCGHNHRAILAVGSTWVALCLPHASFFLAKALYLSNRLLDIDRGSPTGTVGKVSDESIQRFVNARTSSVQPAVSYSRPSSSSLQRRRSHRRHLIKSCLKKHFLRGLQPVQSLTRKLNLNLVLLCRSGTKIWWNKSEGADSTTEFYKWDLDTWPQSHKVDDIQQCIQVIW